MKIGQKLWTRDELILAINLYCKLPFGKMHKSNKEIIQFANLIGRTPSSIALKLVNFASFDPTLKERGIKGASNTSKLDKQIWDEFYNNWDAALIESEYLLAKRKKTTVEILNKVELDDLLKKGKEKERLVKVRVPTRPLNDWNVSQDLLTVGVNLKNDGKVCKKDLKREGTIN
jgi:putative restriction endonuclease